MKKFVIYLFVVAFVASFATVAFGRTLEEEKQAVRDYLKVVDAKIIKYRKAGNKAKMTQLQKEKKGTLARWEKLKAQMEAAPTPPPPPPPPPPPAPISVKPAPAPMAGLFGWGLNTDVAGVYMMTGKGKISGGLMLRGDIVLDDPMALGSMIGMSANAVNYKLGLGGLYGVDINGNRIKAIPVFADVILNIPADAMGGIDSYVGAGLNYTVYGSGQTSGSYGAQVYYGMKSDLGLGLGKTAFEIGWGAIRANGATPKLSSKGFTLSICQPVVL
ncbi:hypothetical protein A3K48_00475 [candidate division WOR-1 bacterium RIFOXYA12_FULL_52_29]|uniref:Outer membrane protein beta-barrel domain-containing protein n=1 Tax=candidate division WOR-1 bacterium RIFOXYC12_FULL_54_18 TaxID=1802584 RepID=A0A1F4T458_UNCSA|nr:MAG: hypothetical protein A3K44_00475 [candidate division WOR-1 bacterium RIFOXYA2_FULL_51_19]OGC17077.1 MAG: hypothetical protein A3K48_00475 [candidate division WOR-1 bacterium RIFOXYA12_FULL_52_29]OGC25938.1 MAG: hypothetical protein A3K32_00475 [candidate division WOR-1 bacterium RIFOXYB2_FULL_45_9]OGC27494.1 MAG: hypothetical protein A3K49_00475 [candidate division WOR-1 bacterium RIFOXYC12_FULL_54_18]OGC29293.1 MAG: hypothetical protein A2346_01230 [candidate division WOR-1 bacterium R